MDFGATPQLRVSREWIGVLDQARKQNRIWNGFWLATAMIVTVVLAVTHAHPFAYAIPVLAILVAILSGTRRVEIVPAPVGTGG